MSFSFLRDFLVSECSKNISRLGSNGIVGISLPHLMFTTATSEITFSWRGYQATNFERIHGMQVGNKFVVATLLKLGGYECAMHMFVILCMLRKH